MVEAAGKLITSPDTALYSGATVGSNNTAELQALIELFDYLERLPDRTPVKIYTDSQ